MTGTNRGLCSRLGAALLLGAGSLLVGATGAAAEPVAGAKQLPAGGGAGDGFGRSVAVEGRLSAVGAPDSGGTGAAYVFRKFGETWSEQTRLTSSDSTAGDQFGESVAVANELIVVGAPGSSNPTTIVGAAYVFRHDGSSWVEEARLTAPDEGGGDEFGSAVAVSADVIAVGAPGDVDENALAGAAYLFRFDGSGWNHEADLAPVESEAGDRFGASISVDGNAAVVGADGASDGSPFSGAAYVFRLVAMDWVQEARLVASDSEAFDLFGAAVSIDGDRALIGADGDDDDGSFSGSAYVFREDGGAWNEEAKLRASDGAGFAQFGLAVAIEADAAVVGAPFALGNASSAGAAYYFRNEPAGWVEDQKLTATDGAALDGFGSSVSLTANTTAVGADGNDDNGLDSGAAYFFPVPEPSVANASAATLATLAALARRQRLRPRAIYFGSSS